MYAHDITTRGAITRLFDVLLARDPVFTVYLFTAIVRARRAELFATPAAEPEMLHSILSKLPRPLDLDGLIAHAAQLEARFPPEGLGAAWRGISRWSVLKTSRGGPGRQQSVEEGRVCFEQQARELRWAERTEGARRWMWRNRRPARAAGVAVLVGVLAVLLPRGVLPGPVASALGYVSGLLARWWR